MKRNIKDRIAESFDLPKEVVLNVPNVKLTGNEEVYIENHKGILEYSKEVIRINSSIGILKITGEELKIKEIGQDNIAITGEIIQLEFIK